MRLGSMNDDFRWKSCFYYLLLLAVDTVVLMARLMGELEEMS